MALPGSINGVWLFPPQTNIFFKKTSMCAEFEKNLSRYFFEVSMAPEVEFQPVPGRIQSHQLNDLNFSFSESSGIIRNIHIGYSKTSTYLNF